VLRPRGIKLPPATLLFFNAERHADDDDTRLAQSIDDLEWSTLDVVDVNIGLISLADFGSLDLSISSLSSPARQFSSTTDSTDDGSLRRLRVELRFSRRGLFHDGAAGGGLSPPAPVVSFSRLFLLVPVLGDDDDDEDALALTRSAPAPMSLQRRLGAGLLCRRTVSSLMSNVTTEPLRGIAGDSNE